jgi:hypothetical protein
MKKNVKSQATISWSDALADAKRKHAEGRAYTAKMRRVIRVIERKIADGEPFPGENKEEISV